MSMKNVFEQVYMLISHPYHKDFVLYIWLKIHVNRYNEYHYILLRPRIINVGSFNTYVKRWNGWMGPRFSLRSITEKRHGWVGFLSTHYVAPSKFRFYISHVIILKTITKWASNSQISTPSQPKFTLDTEVLSCLHLNHKKIKALWHLFYCETIGIIPEKVDYKCVFLELF